MNIKPNAQELTKVSNILGIDIVILNDNDSNNYIKSIINKFKPFKIIGHLSIGNDSLTIPLEKYEFLYSKLLNCEPAYIFFDQEGFDRNTVVVVKDAKLIGSLMENSYGMEYFISNEKLDYLIAVNWYVIEASGSAIEYLSKLSLG
ncbi:hypothetical protein GK047_01185 [Paenibacillus sp. SYP-B3998]|uniref:Uncharacterized protein n=1 Tax=Paenibacillus sp. SYP-B3998 TaxID=2678564 RepID=A0A6G3ZRH6_9BACL|nr:hypothetical protein [Paenibacillus sp. SYP-B3998]NEW04638.1 hypothetical protein [Paenibacillus sp. SYP-B3998]